MPGLFGLLGSWTMSLFEMRDLGLTSSVPGGQAPLYPPFMVGKPSGLRRYSWHGHTEGLCQG